MEEGGEGRSRSRLRPDERGMGCHGGGGWRPPVRSRSAVEGLEEEAGRAGDVAEKPIAVLEDKGGATRRAGRDVGRSECVVCDSADSPASAGAAQPRGVSREAQKNLACCLPCYKAE